MADNKVQVDIVAQTSQFNAAIKGAQNQFNGFHNTIEGAVGKIKTAFVALASAFAVKEIAELENHFAELAEQINRTAQMTGLSTDAIQEFNFAVKLSGGNSDSAATAIQRLERNLVEASSGAGQAARTFNALGIDVKDAVGKIRPIQDIMADIAEKFKNANDGAVKTAYAMQLMGRSGAELIPIFNEGKEGLAALNAELEKTGSKMTQEQIDRFEKLNQKIDILSASYEGFKLSVAEFFEPAAEKVVGWLTSITQWAQGVVRGFEDIITKFQLMYASVTGNSAEVNRLLATDSGIRTVTGQEGVKNKAAEKSRKGDLTAPPTEEGLAQARKIAEEKIKQQQQLAKATLAIGAENDKQALAMEDITQLEYLRRSYDYQKAIDNVEIVAATQRLHAVKGDAAEEAAAQTDLDNIKLQSKLKELRASYAIQTQQREETVKNYRVMFDSFKTGIGNMTEQLIRGTISIRTAFRNMCGDMIIQFARMQVENVAKALWAAGISKNISMTSMLMERGASAVKAASATYASVAAIPLVGWLLAPPAAAAAFAGVMAFGMPSAAGGWADVPNDGLAMIHKKEMVLPAPLADRVRNMTDGGSGGANHFTFNISALDGASVKDMFMKHGGAIMQTITHQTRNLNPRGMAA